MSLLDDLIINFENLNRQLTEAKKVVLSRSQDFKESASIRLEILKQTRTLDNLYKELGKRAYDAKKEDADILYGDYIEKIDEAVARLHALEISLKVENTDSSSFDDAYSGNVSDSSDDKENYIYIDEKDLK